MMSIHKIASVFFLCNFLFGLLTQAYGQSLDPDSDYNAKRSAPVNYDVDLSIVVTAPHGTEVLKVWIPVANSDFAQEVTESQFSTFPMEVAPRVGTESMYGNKFAYFEFKNPKGGQIIRHRFKVKAYQLNWDLQPEKLEEVAQWPASFEKYQRNESQSVVVDDRFETLLQEIVPEKSIPNRDFSDVMSWVQTNFEYDHSNASLTASSEHALETRRGHCSDYHGFCASMGRALGVPTRVTYGIIPLPKDSPSHCKLEAFLAPYGWVCFDVSETQKLMKKIQAAEELSAAEKNELLSRVRQRMEQGYRDNTWFLQTRGTDYDLVPKASKRVPVVRTAYIEADGVALPEPDPSDVTKTTYSWMTVHKYSSDREVKYAYSSWETLKKESDKDE